MNDSCGCCEGIQKITPEAIANRPGLDILAYRVGTHAAFLETMMARLSNFYLDIPTGEFDAQGKPRTARIYPLKGLTTRSADDPSIALLDAWATVADVLTFYQERIATEGYLRTAVERRSILELARLVGYTLRPGVAATVYLAYTLDPNFKDPVVIPVGTRAQSVPGPGELPQSFETADPLEARAAWNVLKPRMTRPQTLKTINSGGANSTQPDGPRVYLKGTGTNLKPNDPLLIDFGTEGKPDLYRVMAVQPDPKSDRTLVLLQHWVVPSQKSMAASAEIVTAESKQQLTAILARYLGEEADKFGVSRNTKRFTTVSNQLGLLQQRLEENVPFPEMMAHLRNDTLPALETAREKAPQRTQLWLNGLVAELGGFADRTVEARAEALAREFTLAPMPGGGNDGGRDIGGIADVDFKDGLAGLEKPASVPPRNALVLDRSYKTAFQAKADNNLQVVGAFRDDLRPSLATVVANTKVTRDVAIKVYALRVKAALFGSNAPRKPDGLDEKKVMHTKEWDSTDMKGAEDFIQVASYSGAVYESSVVYLDNSYDKILSDSWVVVDTSAVDKSKTGPVKVVKFPTLVAKAKDPKADISRAEYGLTGKSTRIELSDPTDVSKTKPWIQLTQSSAPYGSPGEPQLSVRLLESAGSAVNPATNEFQIIRRTTVYAQSEELPLAEEPIDDPICGSEDAADPNAFIELDGVYSGLQAGRWLIVSGERTDIQVPDPNHSSQTVPVTGIMSSELVMLSEVVQRVSEADQETQGYGYYGYGYGPHPVSGERTHTYIRLATQLEYCYRRDTVTIYGNVVRATHGETRNEVLGSGDASKPFQSFTLKQSPLTYVSAPTPAGAESTLHVRVNDVEWHETDNLSELGRNDRYFITRASDDEKTTVIFGNGEHGARPPTGIENIKAAYRNGIGKAGNVKAEQISLLASRPLGVKEVINPLRASGGADKESRDQARRNAPLGVLALDRLVSTQDYADLARTFAGIGKASAARLSDGRRQVVYVTIAGADDIPIDPSSDLYRNLVKALHDYGDPDQPVRVEVRELILIVISANVRIQPDYQWEPVAKNIRTKLLDTFSFERRELGQDVLLSEVITAIQSVAGVAYVDVDLLRGIPEKKPDEKDPSQRRLLTPTDIAAAIQDPLRDGAKHVIPEPLARVAVNLADVKALRPAQLALLSPAVDATLILKEIKP